MLLPELNPLSSYRTTSINADFLMPRPSLASSLQRFSAHKYAPALLNYTTGALVFTGAALLFSGVGALPGLIMMGIGMAAFVVSTTLLACHLRENIGTSDYVVFSGECFVWGACFVFTLPTIILLITTLHYVTRWLDPLGSADKTSSDFTFLTRAPRRQKGGDLAFSGLECA